MAARGHAPKPQNESKLASLASAFVQTISLVCHAAPGNPRCPAPLFGMSVASTISEP